MAVVYNCFAHLESIARFPRPVGSCVFVILARCRARLAWTYPYDFAITRDILPPNTPSTQALEVMNCYAEEAPDRFPTPAAAHKLALADVVAWWRFELAAMARALRTSADRARFPRPFCFCVFVLVASRSQRGLRAVTGQSSRPQYDAISR